MPVLDADMSVAVADLVAVQQHLSLRAFAQPGDHLREFALSIARHTCHTDDLAGAHIQRESRAGRQTFIVLGVNILHIQNNIPRACWVSYPAERSHRAPPSSGPVPGGSRLSIGTPAAVTLAAAAKR